jgi:hypothetical protein
MVNLQSEFQIKSNNDVVRIGCISDTHIGASSMNNTALINDLQRMVDMDCRIGINGDIFDAILHSDIKRYNPLAVDPRLHQMQGTPLDNAIKLAYDTFAPFATHIDWIGIGNHEDHVKKRHHICITSILIDRLNQLPGVNIRHGGWCGFWHLMLNKQGLRTAYTIYRHHGAGGSAPMTKGLLDTQRMMIWLSNIDCIWIGHKHNRWVSTDIKARYDSNTNKTKMFPVVQMMTGSYLETYGDADTGTAPSYAEAWNLAPQMQGGIILELKQQEMWTKGKKSTRTVCRVIM